MTSPDEIWILCDSRSAIQHLSDWTNVGDKTSVSILKNLKELSQQHEIYFQWIPSHIGLFGNDTADLLAKEELWKTPPTHPWYNRQAPGGALSIKADRVVQTTISRLASGHIRGLSFNLGQKIYENCTKCNLVQATPDHLLFCAGLEREDIYSSPLLVKEYLGQLRQKRPGKPGHDFKVGDVVMIEEPSKKRLYWPLGKVISLLPGRDGKVRTLKLKCKNSELIRPIHRVYPLEVPFINDEIVKIDGVPTSSANEDKLTSNAVIKNKVTRSDSCKIGGVDAIVEVDESKFRKMKYGKGRPVNGKWVFGGAEKNSNKCFSEWFHAERKNVCLLSLKNGCYLVPQSFRTAGLLTIA
ncbi:RNase H domain-containing protein [Trichonephila clavipes]|nr:RNase H domain-containing protein [Trichonephila clavipes]